jgi:hypothetical protein
MLNFVKLPLVLTAMFLYSYVPMVSGQSSLDRRLAAALEDSLPQLVMAEDHRAASSVAMQLAVTRSHLGDTVGACAALEQSLDSYRKAVAKESGISEPALSSVSDSSDGMAMVRAKFGCGRV